MTQRLDSRKGKGRTATREMRREQLIAATIDSISKRGFSGTTLATVTKGAKLSHGVVNFHFDSKEDLYDQTLGYLAKEHYEAWHGAMQKAGPDPAAQLAAVVGADFDPGIASPKKLAVWFAFWGQARYRPNYLKIHYKFDDERFAEISRLCHEIVAEGGYDHLDGQRVARCIEALIDGLWLSMMLYPKDAERRKGRSDCFGYLAQVFPKHFADGEAARDCQADSAALHSD